MNKLTEILAEMQNPATPPARLSEILLYFSAQFAMKSAELQGLSVLKVAAWPELRKEAGSDKQADRAWDATAEGLHEMALRLEMKSLEKLMSALRTHLRNKEIEARNQF